MKCWRIIISLKDFGPIHKALGCQFTQNLVLGTEYKFKPLRPIAGGGHHMGALLVRLCVLGCLYRRLLVPHHRFCGHFTWVTKLLLLTHPCQRVSWSSEWMLEISPTRRGTRYDGTDWGCHGHHLGYTDHQGLVRQLTDSRRIRRTGLIGVSPLYLR